VFIHLSQNASKVSRQPFLGGWLHRDTCFTASKLMRSERRREAREREAVFMNSLQDHSEAHLEKVGPVLDEAINLLGEEDRAAIVLRFFEQRDFRSVGAALGSNEDAARMRVNRALEKLQSMLQRRGVALSAAALGAALASEAVTAAPVGLAASVAGAAVTTSAVAGILTTLLKVLTMTKIKAGVISAVVVASVATSLVVYNQAQARLRQQESSLQQQEEQLKGLAAENERLSKLAAPGSAAPAEGTSQELARLRRETEALRQKTNSLAMLRAPKGKQQPAVAEKAKTPLQEKEESIAKLNYSRDWLLAFMLYSQEHQGRFPTNFDDAAGFLREQTKNQADVTSDQFEIVFQGVREKLTNAANVIVLREKEPRQSSYGNWLRAYAFADGHSEIHSEADGNFEAWEKRRMITPQVQ
jgi:membrane protein implicated in regulation of membrane protease activity